MSNIKNIKKAVGNTIGAATSVVAVSTEIVADTSGLVANTIGATPSVLKALLISPFSAAKGYLMEAEGMKPEEAETAAFHYIEQDVAVTIAQGGEGAGKILAQLLDEDEDPITTSERKEVIDQ